jgi:hypothetical protein
MPESDGEMPQEPASNGCSRPTKPAPKWAAPIPIQRQPPATPSSKSHNHCAEVLDASIGEVIPGSEGYIIWQDERLIETAQTYDEATRKGKVVKRRHPKAKVEIQYSGVTVELK